MTPLYFDGETYESALDKLRLGKQLLSVRLLMYDGVWRTLREIANELGIPEASASARLRDLRKERFGSHRVERRRRGEEKRGLFEYCVQGQGVVDAEFRKGIIT